MRPPIYQSQRWLFDTAVGRFDVDLSVSGIGSRSTAGLLAKVAHHAGYSLDRGSVQLRAAIAAAYRVDRECVAVTHGAQEAMYLLMASTLESGDSVAVHTPGWQQHTQLPERFGATMRHVPAGDGDRLDLAALLKAGRGARMMVLSSPHNPTGLMLDERVSLDELLPAVADGLLVVNDEEYLTDYLRSTVHQLPGSCSVSSLSKIYGFAGLRVGWLVGPPEVVEACVNYRRYTTISNSPILEAAAVMVFDERERYVREYEQVVADRWPQFEQWAERQEWLRVRRPYGTPYAWCSYDLPVASDLRLCEYLLDCERVLLMPGSVFGAPDTLRITFTRPSAVLANGLSRVERAVGLLQSLR